jgi:membrane protease subunit HflK
MPWNSEGGGNNQGPWGNGSGGKNQQPNLEDFLRKFQENLKQLMPKGYSSFATILGIFGIISCIWLTTGFYRVNEGEQAVVLRFGKWVGTTLPGLRYHLPYPIEEIIKKSVSVVNRIDSGAGDSTVQIAVQGLRGSEDQPLMLTGDENIVDINFTVLWFIKDLGQFTFKARVPEETVKIAAESVVREIIAQTPFEEIITTGRGEINERAQQKLQKLSDDYQLGIQIQEVRLQKVEAPASVIDAFRDVQRARTDQERLVNEAESYKNSIVPVAEGEAVKITQAAEAYKAAKVAQSEGDAARFISTLTEYRMAPDVTRKRIYIETMQSVLKLSNKVYFDRGTKSTQGILPHMALPALRSEAANLQENKEGNSQ